MNSQHFPEVWPSWEIDPSTRTSVHVWTKYAPIDVSVGTSAVDLFTVDRGVPSVNLVKNPSFEVINPLLSRCKTLKLKPLNNDALEMILNHSIKSDIILSQKNIVVDKTVQKKLIQKLESSTFFLRFEKSIFSTSVTILKKII